MARRCNSCNRLRHQSSYSVSQWSAGEGNSRCAPCVNIYGSPFLATPPPPEASGFNHASGGSVSYRQLENPFASGQYRRLAKGNYTSGVHKGKACVVKWFKSTATAFENDYFAIDRTAVEQAITILSEFNKLAIADKPLKVNVPAAWKFDDAITDWGGRKALCEPFIQNYEKYNSNTGWRNNYWGDGTNLWSSVMQALSHFSYHITEREYVLCDLQGGVYADQVVLSNPVILSQAREYGVTDLGPNGIYNFFHQHTCNAYCRADWMRPAVTEQHFAPVPHTTMAPL